MPKKIKFVKIEKISDINDFNKFMIYELWKYIRTGFILQIHYDGFVVNPESWKDEFLDYDYIGSPWPIAECFKDKKGDYVRVGNSVGIRSKRLLKLPAEVNMPFTPDDNGGYNEDIFICCRQRHLFENEGIQFAPFELARYFGREIELPENKDIEPFLFHKWRGQNEKYPQFTSFETMVLNKILRVKKFIRKK